MTEPEKRDVATPLDRAVDRLRKIASLMVVVGDLAYVDSSGVVFRIPEEGFCKDVSVVLAELDRIRAVEAEYRTYRQSIEERERLDALYPRL